MEAEFAPKVYWKPVDVADRLSYLDLTPDVLWDAVLYGQGYAAECTLNDPPSTRGFITWGKTNRMLRDLLIPKGWSQANAQNYATTVHPSGSSAIAVASGDSYTGIPDKRPSTRTDKGPATEQAIAVNQLSFASIPGSGPEWEQRQTWLLLHYLDEESDEVRAELSLPTAISPEGRVGEWQERIILPPPSDGTVGRGATLVDDTPGDSGEIDVPVEKRA